ncbi:hypothetical protein HNW13_018055 [Shewanella sp. BF02_Schw]|uniref:hypothetical protein n=1 Tax=Shewanella sp. BF02_Schw TaxID=394908 RepID=UPI00177E97E8|nr:hypothetical protein [Shewanella sp. BF02_Schw]MBO1897644.1 hypothetical protein [Shewanella sp. BF02_Schw]
MGVNRFQNNKDRLLVVIKSFFEKIDLAVNFSQPKQIEYLLELSTWMADGVKPIDALTGISEIYALSGKSDSIPSKATASIVKAMSAGQPMYVGMTKYFSRYLVTIFKSAEETGTMDKALKLLAEDDIQIKELKSIFFKPVIPVSMYLILMLASAVNIVENVFPPISRGKPFDEWPESAQNFSNMMNMFTSYWIFILIGLIVLGTAIMKALENNTSPLRMELDTFPILNSYRTFIANQYLKMLSVLMLSNIKPIEALKIIEANGTPYLAWHAKEAQKRLDLGETEIGRAIDTGIIADDVLVKMQYLTSVSTNEGKVKGLRVTAERSIGLAMKSLKRSGLFIAVAIGILLVYILLSAAMALITLSVAK